MTDKQLGRRGFLQASASGVVLAGLGAQSAAAASNTDDDTDWTAIEDWNDLDAVRDNLDGDYVLLADLDETTDGYEDVAGPSANGGEGFDPIGSIGNGFTGRFNGHGNTISDLVVDRSGSSWVGLFGVVDDGATVSNVSLANADITGNGRVGSIAGGISDGEVTRSTASGTVSGEEAVGGLVGVTFDGGVAESSATTDVTGEELVGGLVGLNSGELTESWAAGSVAGSADVGGFVGSNGENNDGEVTAGYWDTDASEQEDGFGNGEGDVTGLTTEEMQGTAAEENMPALDFEATWQAVTDPAGYPQLREPETDIDVEDSDSETENGDDAAADDDDDSLPGFGVGAAIAGLGGAGYFVKRRFADDKTQ